MAVPEKNLDDVISSLIDIDEEEQEEERRPAPAREQPVALSARAAKQIHKIRSDESLDEELYLRVAVEGGGCSGLQYKMDLQDQPASRDILVESSGVKVVVDPKSALYVTGSELDYVEALQGGGFKVTNPNAATSCSCGESFSA
jgi:iron-sulfur cluster assembly accessory protein